MCYFLKPQGTNWTPIQLTNHKNGLWGRLTINLLHEFGFKGDHPYEAVELHHSHNQEQTEDAVAEEPLQRRQEVWEMMGTH